MDNISRIDGHFSRLDLIFTVNEGNSEAGKWEGNY